MLLLLVLNTYFEVCNTLDPCVRLLVLKLTAVHRGTLLVVRDVRSTYLVQYYVLTVVSMYSVDSAVAG